MGGVLAFEMARQLTAAGEEVGLVALIDSALPGDGGEVDEWSLLSLFARDLGGLFGAPLPLGDATDLRGLASEEALRRVLAEARHRGLFPPDLREEDLHGLFEVFRANATALRLYRPAPWPGRLLLLQAMENAAGDGAPGWCTLALGGAEAAVLAGTHYTLLRRPEVARVAELLQGALAGPARRGAAEEEG
jgi:thioesterase domain-containing protein